MKLLVEKIYDNAILPNYAHCGDAGIDLYSVDDVILEPGEYKTVSTGLKIKLPEGTEGQIRPRSGLAAKHGISLVNSPGTIDEGYRGELKIIVINLGKKKFHIEVGSKIAQMVVAPVLRIEVKEVKSIEENTSRGNKGFGSSGTK
ncbi:MAG: dUTP diphosphatase [Filifactoraceae bacterium]